jgi:hypothetical protein
MPRGVYDRSKTAKKKSAKSNARKLKIDLSSAINQTQIKPELLTNVIQHQAPSYHKKLMDLLENKKEELYLLSGILTSFESLDEDARYRVYAYFKDKFSKYAQQQV